MLHHFKDIIHFPQYSRAFYIDMQRVGLELDGDGSSKNWKTAISQYESIMYMHCFQKKEKSQLFIV